MQENMLSNLYKFVQICDIKQWLPLHSFIHSFIFPLSFRESALFVSLSMRTPGIDREMWQIFFPLKLFLFLWMSEIHMNIHSHLHFSVLLSLTEEDEEQQYSRLHAENRQIQVSIGRGKGVKGFQKSGETLENCHPGERRQRTNQMKTQGTKNQNHGDTQEDTRRCRWETQGGIMGEHGQTQVNLLKYQGWSARSPTDKHWGWSPRTLTEKHWGWSAR